MTRADALRLAALGALAPSRAFGQGLTAVRAGSTLDDAVTPVLYGLKAGLFRDAGLDVQLSGFASGNALTAAVAGGSIDVGKSSQIPLIAAHVRGAPFCIVAGAAEYSSDAPTTVLIVAKDSPLRTAADLNGKTISTTALTDVNQLATEAWVDAHGGDARTLRFVEYSNSAAPEAVEQGRIDAATLSNPVLAQALQTGRVRIFAPVFDAIGKRFLTASWFCTEDYVARNTETVRRFVAVLRRASAYTNAHHAETVDLLAGYAHIDPATIRAMNRLTNATRLDPREIQPLIDAAVRYRMIPKAFPARELIADVGG